MLVEQVASLAAQNESLVGSWRSLPGCAGLDPAVNLLAGGFEHVWAIATAVERDAWLLEQLPAPLARSVVGARRTKPALAVAAHRALVDAVAAAVFALTGTTGEDESRFAGDRGLLRAWEMTRPGRDTDRPRATALARWCEASEALKPLRGPLADARWRLLTGAVAPEDATQALARGLADASLSERWDAGGFAAFDASRQGHCVDRFVMGSDQLRTSLATALPAALLERRPFEPGALFGKVGALEREIGRTRGGLSVRRLVEQYGDVIGAITPCVLVSPDSMARFLPPGSMSFDLVVFDEASQITVADAIGALGRAQAAVIAGDSKQLPPSSFADIGAEDREDLESEFLVVPDEESILTGGSEPDLAVVALPKPGRVAHRLLQCRLLRGPALQLPRVCRAGARHRDQLHPPAGRLPAQRRPGTPADQPRGSSGHRRGGAAAVGRPGAVHRCGDLQHPTAVTHRDDALGE